MKISGSTSSIEKVIINAALNHINIGFMSCIGDIRSTTKTLIAKALVSSKEYNSIIAGELQGHFGLAAPALIMQQMVKTLSEDVEIVAKPFRYLGSNRISGGLNINIIKKDMTEILSLPGAEYISYTKKNGAQLVPWLRWLLFSTDNMPLVENSDITFNLTARQKTYSRSKKALMLEKPGLNYTLPPEYGGGRDGNWVVRAMEDGVAFPLLIYIEEIFLQRIP